MTAVDLARTRDGNSPSPTDNRQTSKWRDAGVRGLERITHIGMSIAIIGVPLTMAGIRDAGVALFVLCSLVMAVTWALREILQPVSRARLCGAEVIMGLALALVGLQLMPLPMGLLSFLSPFVGEYLTLWGASEGRSFSDASWQQISLTPELTRSGLVLLIAYAAFFLTLVHQLRTRNEIDRLLRLVAIAVVVMAMIGLGQLFFGNGRYLWMIEHPYRNAVGAAKGTFTNQNHFAGFLSLGIGPLIWCWSTDSNSKPSPIRSSKRRRRPHEPTPAAMVTQYAFGAGVAAVIFAALLSLSRGGIAAVVVALIVTSAGFQSDLKRIGKVVAGAMGFAIAGVIAAGAGPLAEEWQGITSASSFDQLSHGRLLLWGALLRASASFWPAGSGLGSHAEVYPTWLTHQSDFRFSHAENGYLQVLLEMGLPGLLLLIAGISLCVRWCSQTWRHSDKQDRRRIVAIAAGLVASIAHSCVDFVWYIPGCTIVTLALAACACRCFQLSRPSPSPALAPRPRYGISLAWAMLLLALPTVSFCADVTSRNVRTLADRNSFRHHAVRSSKATRNLSMKAVDANLDHMIANLEACLSANPHDHGAATDLSVLLLRRFESSLQSAENKMTLREVQDTVRHSGFESPQAAHDWLQRAFGDCVDDLDRSVQMAKHSLLGQPLRGEAYIVLAETGVLTGSTDKERAALIQQAVRLRPHDPAVLFSAGAWAIESGDIDLAFAYWERAYAYDLDIRRELITRLAQTLSASELDERFDPDADGLWMMFDTYRKAGRDEEALHAARLFIRRLPQFASSAAFSESTFWLHTREIMLTLDKPHAALNCLKEAVRCAPDNIATRRQLAFALLDAGDSADAAKQLKWCRLRTPDDTAIDEALERISHQRTASRYAAADNRSPL